MPVCVCFCRALRDLKDFQVFLHETSRLHGSHDVSREPTKDPATVKVLQ